MKAWSRSAPARLVRRGFQDGVLLPALRSFCTPFRSVSNAGPSGSSAAVLIVANHASHLDAPAVLAALPPRIRHRTAVAAAEDYFYRSPVIGAAASLGIGTFAFPRHGRDGCEHAAELLANDWNVLLFPQGSRGSSDAWRPFRSGVGHLVAQTGVRVLPVGLVGTRRLWPRGQRFPRRGQLEVRLGDAWEPPCTMSPAAIAAELERQVRELWAQATEAATSSSSISSRQ